MTPRIPDVWAYLSASPLLGLTPTLVACRIAYWIYGRTGFNPLFKPVLLAVAMLVVALQLTGTPYATYFDGAQFVHFLFGPASAAR
jgi:putative effector of murein hydrolase